MRQQLPMIHIYYILLLIINIILSALYGPRLLALIKRYFTRIKRKLNAPSKIDIRLDEFDKQLNNLSKKITNVNNNNRDLIKKTVREYLEQLKNK
jgi:hypothetical protein